MKMVRRLNNAYGIHMEKKYNRAQTNNVCQSVNQSIDDVFAATQ